MGLVEEGGQKNTLCFGKVIRLMMFVGYLPTISTTLKSYKNELIRDEHIEDVRVN